MSAVPATLQLITMWSLQAAEYYTTAISLADRTKYRTWLIIVTPRIIALIYMFAGKRKPARIVVTAKNAIEQ